MIVLKAPDFLNGKSIQIIAAFSATVSCIAGGMQYAWTAPIIPILESENTPIPIKKSEIVWIENTYMLGSFVGIPFTIYFLNQFGRKNSILIGAVQCLITWIITALASTVEWLYVARVISGFASNICFVSTPMYIAEIADKKIRGFLGSWVYLMMLVGIVILYAVAPFVTIVVSSAVGAVFVIIQLVTLPLMPDSPYYLLLKNKNKEAKKALERFRFPVNVDKELTEIAEAVERQKQEEGRLIDLFTIASNRKALIIMTVLNGAQHFSSISVMVMNLHIILDDAASMLEPTTTAIIFSVIMVITATIASSMIDKSGRKLILITSSIITSLSLMALAIYFAIKNANIDVSPYSWIPVASVMVYGGAFKYGLGMVPIVMTGELFPTSVKAMGMTLANAVYVIASLISVYLYQFLADAYGMHAPFALFAVSCIVATAFIIYYIPETKGKTLEEIQLMLKGNKAQKNTNEINETC